MMYCLQQIHTCKQGIIQELDFSHFMSHVECTCTLRSYTTCGGVMMRERVRESEGREREGGGGGSERESEGGEGKEGGVKGT